MRDVVGSGRSGELDVVALHSSVTGAGIVAPLLSLLAAAVSLMIGCRYLPAPSVP